MKFSRGDLVRVLPNREGYSTRSQGWEGEITSGITAPAWAVRSPNTSSVTLYEVRFTNWGGEGRSGVNVPRTGYYPEEELALLKKAHPEWDQEEI